MSNSRFKSKLQCTIDVPEELCRKGFSAMKSADFVASPELARALSRLREECRDLPADPRAKNGERRRRYARYIYLPWRNCLALQPVTTYSQESSLNPDDGGTVRQFEELTPGMRTNKFLKELIRRDFAMLPISDEEACIPWDVGVHVVQMFARPGIPGISSPDCLHKDGEPFTYIHLLERRDVIGGENIVADNSKRIILDCTLTDPMDSLVIRDEAVYHQVKRIEVAPGAQEGFRTSLLIDFTPMFSQTIAYRTAVSAQPKELIEELHCPKAIKEELRTQGYSFVRGTELRGSPVLERQRRGFLEAFRDVPLELVENCKDQNRGRRVQEFDLLPQTRQLVPRLPTMDGFVEYQLSAGLNPEYNGVTRKFHSLTEKQRQNDFFQTLVFWYFDQLPLTEEEKNRPLEVGVHLIDYRPRVGLPSVPTPNRPHRDGEPWVMIALVHRQAVSGGQSTVHDDFDTEVFRVTLTDPLDLIILNDEMVKHHVHEITAATSAEEASRVALAVDITPLGKMSSRRA
jgi:hypothetical protein